MRSGPLYFGKWHETERTNISETRATRELLSHLTRAAWLPSSHVFVLNDSLAATITLTFRGYGSYRYVWPEVKAADGVTVSAALCAAGSLPLSPRSTACWPTTMSFEATPCA